MAPSLPVLEDAALQVHTGRHNTKGSTNERCGAPLRPRSGRLHTAPAHTASPSAASLCGSRSESCLSLATASGRSRLGSGRFRPDEMICFKKLPLPSPMFPRKAEVYCGQTLGQKSEMTERGLHTLPAMKGEFYRFNWEQFHQPVSQMNETARSESLVIQPELPLEAEERQTATVLQQIYPIPREENVEKVPRKVVTNKKAFAATTQAHSASGSKEKAAPADANRADRRIAAQRTIRHFRHQLLERFATMSGAFEMFAAETAGGAERELSRKDFSRFLDKHFRGLSREDHAQVFAFLDTDKSGTISIGEFHTAIEATAPVRSMEDLRRKLIALGYSSMRQVIREIEYHLGCRKGLTAQEFGQALSKIGITQGDEHESIFQVVVDPNGPAKQVTVEQLAAALSSVSPSLLLEDVRDRLLKRYGSMNAAFSALDIDSSYTVTGNEFIRHATTAWKLEFHEANKAFRMVDIDKSQEIHRHEFSSALGLAEPSLFHEDIRRKVRQRFRSISEALLKDEFGLPTAQAQVQAGQRALATPVPQLQQQQRSAPDSTPHNETAKGTLDSSGTFCFQRRSTVSHVTREGKDGLGLLTAFARGDVQEDAAQRKTPALFKDILQKVQLTDSETQMLFRLVDTDKDGTLTPVEFVRGIRLFAPATVLDDLRLRCLAGHARVADAFAAVPAAKHCEVLQVEGLQQLLDELDLSEGVDVEGIMDLIEPHREGGMTISELVSALQAAAPGAQIPLAPDVRDARVRQQVKATMGPFLNSAKELRAQVRRSLPSKESGNSVSLPNLNSKGLSAVPEDKGGFFDEPEPECNTWGQTSHAPAPIRQSYMNVSKCVRTLPPNDSQAIVERIHGYYKSAGNRVVTDSELLRSQQSRSQHYRSISGHQAAIERPATLKVADSPKAVQPL